MSPVATRAGARADLEAGAPPERLVPGDLVAINDAVVNSQALGDQLAATARSIRYIEVNGEDWSGGSRNAYDWVQGLDIASFKNAAGVFDDVVTALAGYSASLEGARGEAEVALTNYQQGKAQQDADAAVATSTCDPDLSAPAAPLSPMSIFDTDPYGIYGAITKLVEARHSVELAGARAAEPVRALADLAPQPRRPTVKDNLRTSVDGLFDPVVSLVRSPYDALGNCTDFVSGAGRGPECARDVGETAVLGGLLASRGRGPEGEPFPRGEPPVKMPPEPAGPGAWPRAGVLGDGAATSAERVFVSADRHVADAAAAIEAAMPGRVMDVNSQVMMSNGLKREVDIDLGDLVVQVKGGNARRLAGQLERTSATTERTAIGFAPNMPDGAWGAAARQGIPIARDHDELLALIRELG